MVDWPESLAAVRVLAGATSQRTGAKIESAVDVGQPLSRRRYTAALYNISVTVICRQPQKNAFETFWETDLVEGTLPFNWQDWRDPTSDVPVAYQFRGSDAPAWTQLAGKRWSATFDLRIVP